MRVCLDFWAKTIKSGGVVQLKIFSGNANRPLAQRIADAVGVPLGDAMVTAFPDQETFVKINENIRGRDVFIVQPTCPPANHHLMELLIMIDAARRASAKRITAVVPFFGYARQDRKDQPRVPITAKLVANLIVAAGANRLLTMDLHSQQIMGFFDIPVDHLYAAPVIYRYFNQKKLKDLVVVSPDIGGVKMVHAYAKLFQAPLAIVNKRRKSATEVEMLNVIGDVDGQNVLLVDDLTETAGTHHAGSGDFEEERREEGVRVRESRGVESRGAGSVEGVGFGRAGHDRHGAAHEGQRVQADRVDRRAAIGRGDQADS